MAQLTSIEPKLNMDLTQRELTAARVKDSLAWQQAAIEAAEFEASLPDSMRRKNLHRHVIDTRPELSLEMLKASDSAKPLGKDAKKVGKIQKVATYERYRELRYAQFLLIDHNVLSNRKNRDGGFNIHKTRTCSSFKHHIADSIGINISTATSSNVSRAALTGVNTCGSVWSCPVCARRIATQRGLDVSYTIQEMYKLGYVPIMLTLTARHTLENHLKDFKNKFKNAWDLFKRGNFKHLKKLFDIQHSIKAVEVTRTYENGWHYHMHILLFIHVDELASLNDAEMENWQDRIKKSWLSSLKKAELDGDYEHAAHVMADGNVKDTYLAKLGISDEDTGKAEYELTSGQNKTGYKGRNIWEILRSAKDGNESDMQLYIEYVTALSGDQWLTYSHGLKDLVKLDEMSDVEASQQEENENGVQFERLLEIDEFEYKYVRKMKAYAELLETAAASRDGHVVRDWLTELRISYNLIHRGEDLRKLKEQRVAIKAHLENFERSKMKIKNPLYEPIYVLVWQKKLRGIERELKNEFNIT